MLDVNISDHRLAALFRQHIREWHNTEPRLRGLKLCGSHIVSQPGSAANVYVVASSDSARYFGVATCHSPWACPACSAKVMATKCGEVASLIDARRKWFGESAFMVTFTLPHSAHMSCSEAFQVLKDTWRMFMRAGNRARNNQGKSQGVLGEFRNRFEIKGMARAYEFTWGKENGWHPHIHALFWTRKANFSKLLPYEDLLTDFWLHCAKHCHRKWLEKRSRATRRPEVVEASRKSGNKPEWMNKPLIPAIPPESRPMVQLDGGRLATSDLNDLYAEYKNRPVTGHRAVWFSKNEDGSVRVEKSSFYVSGWGGNSELTGSAMKRSKFEGHYTPLQILLNAQKANKVDSVKKSSANAEPFRVDGLTAFDWLELFTTYAIATRGSKRVQFSPNDQKIIAKWRMSNEFIEQLKKNLTAKAKKTRVVWWFNRQLWQKILLKESTQFCQLRADILQQAIDDPSKIPRLLEEHGINSPHSLPACKEADFIENKILNQYAATG